MSTGTTDTKRERFFCCFQKAKLQLQNFQNKCIQKKKRKHKRESRTHTQNAVLNIRTKYRKKCMLGSGIKLPGIFRMNRCVRRCARCSVVSSMVYLVVCSVVCSMAAQYPKQSNSCRSNSPSVCILAHSQSFRKERLTIRERSPFEWLRSQRAVTVYRKHLDLKLVEHSKHRSHPVCVCAPF